MVWSPRRIDKRRGTHTNVVAAWRIDSAHVLPPRRRRRRGIAEPSVYDFTNVAFGPRGFHGGLHVWAGSDDAKVEEPNVRSGLTAAARTAPRPIEERAFGFDRRERTAPRPR